LDDNFLRQRKRVHYGNGTTTDSYGVLETNVELDDEDGEHKAFIPVKFIVIDTHNNSVLVGFRVINTHKIKITEDPSAVLLPTSDMVLRIQKVRYDEWTAAEALYAQRKISVMEMIEEPYQTKEALFRCSPTY